MRSLLEKGTPLSGFWEVGTKLGEGSAQGLNDVSSSLELVDRWSSSCSCLAIPLPEVRLVFLFWVTLINYIIQVHNFSSNWFNLDLARWNIKIWYDDTFTDLSETGVDARLVFPLSVPPSPFAPVVTLLVSFFVTDFWLRKIIIVNHQMPLAY